MLLLVSGASGAGKTTAREKLGPALGPAVECVELRHLVPMPAAPTVAWRQQAAETAVLRAIALAAEGRHLLLAGDPVPAGEILAAPSAERLGSFAACLLDLGPEVQADRLLRRGDDPTLLIHHQSFAEWMRGHAKDPRHRPEVLSGNSWEAMRWDRLDTARDWAMTVIDTSALDRDAVAVAVLNWCQEALAGRAPRISL